MYINSYESNETLERYHGKFTKFANLPGPVLHQILKYLLNSLEFPE